MAVSRRDKADFYTQRAHKEGYPARSVYKLEEINSTSRLIKPGDTVLDVGAAPGSWTLYTHRVLLKERGKIVSVDLNPLSLDPIPPTVTALVGDAFSKEIRARLVEEGPYDAIISDAAPMTTGNRIVDTSRSEYLAEQVVMLAEEQLKTHGNMVIKIFQGGGEQEVLRKMRTIFAKAKAFKPKASRDDSFEIFLIGLDRKPQE
ncbi:MAG: RlmE family RNA methyltransferase [Spirochaetes bacterium]|mgnify:FL=1|uniref:Ribosomal RNA large subunit methyltransferase E n=1 Tax=Candidatus Ornithospirochaeta stercoravium TaxID=2840897 RepID=A0A9D9NE01_9SPIO|nr:RlmE family RNA methyltransferase [Candidatus Ornithospirochaeta stercoravium]